ncbi:hypothetical protein [Streptomonospora salina]|uniref:Putative phage-related endonuclease n=1 Tax=Streptomonospora salina TaxID=104205 RepID=A0A841EAU5_9ACTN|nr:hypothetical protein [Streptomonospora salina]MBB6000255.1 putative phage-related endonuclease [Streptomonospora salina]
MDGSASTSGLITELAEAATVLAAARARYADVEDRLRKEVGEPEEIGARLATLQGRTVARWSAYEERRVNTKALRESWPEIAETVTETRLRTRFTVELPQGVAA